MEKSQSGVEPKKTGKPSVVFNVANTRYAIVKEIGKRVFGWRLTRREDEDWDILWTDSSVPSEVLTRMKPYQKINHFPGMYNITRKSNLAFNLNKLRKVYPTKFQFYPRTWVLPADLGELRKRKPKTVYIVKPEASSQGRGIYLTANAHDFTITDKCVVQEYVAHPLLIDGLKFDLRIYVLVAGCSPLRVYLHKEGLARFATEPYCAPSSHNLDQSRMHLTNYAINKRSRAFVNNLVADEDAVGHKRSLQATLAYLESQGHDVTRLWKRIQCLILKTLCCAQPVLAHTYKACQPFDPDNGMCFELLGFDILVDAHLKPWLVEVNHSPSFNSDSPLDKKVKGQVIAEALELVRVSTQNRKKYATQLKHDLAKRSASKKFEVNVEERAARVAKSQRHRDRWEDAHSGDFLKIYPASDNTQYEEYMKQAQTIWEGSTGPAKRPQSSRPGAQKPKELVSFPTKAVNLSLFERLSKPAPRAPPDVVYQAPRRPRSQLSHVTPHRHRVQTSDIPMLLGRPIINWKPLA